MCKRYVGTFKIHLYFEILRIAYWLAKLLCCSATIFIKPDYTSYRVADFPQSESGAESIIRGVSCHTKYWNFWSLLHNVTRRTGASCWSLQNFWNRWEEMPIFHQEPLTFRADPVAQPFIGFIRMFRATPNRGGQ